MALLVGNFTQGNSPGDIRGAVQILSAAVNEEQMAALQRFGAVRFWSVVHHGSIFPVSDNGSEAVAAVQRLSAAEFRLLRAFLEHPHEVMDRECLLEIIQRRGTEPFDRVLDVQISRLRSRLGESAKEPRLIKTARGDGYLFAASVEKDTE